MFRKFAKIVTSIFFSVFFKVKLIGRENIPEKGPVVLCANHRSMTDMFFIACFINRWIYWMSKHELHKNKLLALILKLLGSFPIRRGKANVESFKTAYKLLEEGHIIGIFPEGTRVKAKKKIVIHDGAALIAQKKKVPVLPVAISGKVRLFGNITVIYGKPMMLKNGAESENGSEQLKENSRMIMDEIYRLAGGKG